MTTPTTDNKESPAADAEPDSDAVANGMYGAVAEILFVVLPLLVIAIVFVSRAHAGSIWLSVEWSFAASVLLGQAVVKLIRALVERGGFHGERVGLIAAVILVLGLVPSLVVLSLILLREPDPPSELLANAQLWLF